MSRSNYYGGRKRDTCYFCSAFGNIEEHHVIPQRFGGKDSEDNIVGLCESCHGKLERLYDKSFYEHFGIEDEQGERRFHKTCYLKDCDEMAVEYWFGYATGDYVHTCEKHTFAGRPKNNANHTLIDTADSHEVDIDE